MPHLRRTWVLALLSLAAVGVAGLPGPDSGGALAQSVPQLRVRPVTVTNTPDKAIPVAVQGTPNVAVSGPVAVSGAVTVANPITINTDEPLPVRLVPEGTPVLVEGQIIVNIGELYDTEQFYTVPSGYRLVIEMITIQFEVPTGQVATYATLLGSAPGVAGPFHFPFTRSFSGFPTHDIFHVVQLTKVPARTGAGVIVSVSRTGTTGAAIATVAISGTLYPTS